MIECEKVVEAIGSHITLDSIAETLGVKKVEFVIERCGLQDHFVKIAGMYVSVDALPALEGAIGALIRQYKRGKYVHITTPFLMKVLRKTLKRNPLSLRRKVYLISEILAKYAIETIKISKGYVHIIDVDSLPNGDISVLQKI